MRVSACAYRVTLPRVALRDRIRDVYLRTHVAHVYSAATNGVVLATEKKLPSILVEEDTLEKIAHYTGNVGALAPRDMASRMRVAVGGPMPFTSPARVNQCGVCMHEALADSSHSPLA